MLNLAFVRGRIAGEHHAQALLRPGYMGSKPRCPYWCPMKVVFWHSGFVQGVHDILHRA